jgi:transposase-like protein
MGTLVAVIRFALAALALCVLAVGPGCRKLEPPKLDPVRALRGRATRFAPPPDGKLTARQVDAFVAVRKAAGSGSTAAAASAAGEDPAEFFWVQARIAEALGALDARKVVNAAFESYGRSIASVREARRTAPDSRTAARLDAEIAALERERASLRKAPAETSPAVAANAALLAPRRAELEAVRP